jgi:hypothetical protein
LITYRVAGAGIVTVNPETGSEMVYDVIYGLFVLSHLTRILLPFCTAVTFSGASGLVSGEKSARAGMATLICEPFVNVTVSIEPAGAGNETLQLTALTPV